MISITSLLAPNSRETVTSVGSAWIICRSKSFAGRTYYFNTLTGEAVWNLSETEVEKAKRRTKLLQSQPGFIIENCPEPPESPKDDPASNKKPSSNLNQFPQHNMVRPKVYNKQVINNRFPTTATLCTPHQYQAFNPMNPIQFNIPVAPVLNPPMWNAAPQQIFVTPTYSQPQPFSSNNNFDHVYLNNMSNTLSNRFSGDGQFHKRHNKYQHLKSPKNCRVNKFKNNNKVDLRLLLSLKRRETQIKEKVSQLRANAAITNNNKYKQDVNPLSTRIRRKSYCLDPEEDRVNYDEYKHLNFTHRDKKQDGNGPNPSRVNSKSYSFNANEEENNEWLEHLTIKNTATNQGALSSLPSRRRRSLSFSANEGKNDEDNRWLEQSKNKYTDTNQGTLSSLPSRRRRSFSFSANERENDEDNDWLEQSNDKYTDTNQGNFSPQPSRVRRRSYSFCANQQVETDEANGWLKNSNNKNEKQTDVSPCSTHGKSVRFKLNEEDGGNNAVLGEKFETQRDTINFSERKATSLFQVKENTDVTYIVPDSSVFLMNINLLNDILNTVMECCLLVPKMVMNKIQAATKSHYRALAYKALYFIWQQHEAKLAIIEEESEENENSEDDILNFCCQLIDQEIHVVLITDDTELINSNNANNTNIHIITTAKMQQWVDEYKCNETTTTDIDTEALANIKIIIENETNIQHDEEVIKSPIRKCMSPKKSFNEKQAENRGEGGADNVLQKDKKACGFGVQASFNVPSVSSPSNSDSRNEVLLPYVNVPCKTGGLKLKRNLPTDSKKNTWNRYNTNLAFSLANDRTKAGNSAESAYPITDSTVIENVLSDGKNMTWSLFSNTSTDSLSKINEGSDTSSIVFRNVNQRENITIEDSNSVISNTTSNVDTESERSGVQKANTNIDDRIVMFEVSDSRMEDALRVKMDEWVSRFVQIMEEALSQLLECEPTFALEPMPPPWTVHEAVECVRKHFCRDPDVLAAAERLLAVSRDHGGLRGKIKSNISPQKFMELYSYGVYLIDALQGVLSSNEDLQTASEALSKLLNDIQQSHSDPGAQDSFTDISAQECDANVTTDKDTSQVEVNQDAKKQQIPKGSPIRNNKKQSPASTPSTPGKYNLRSQRKKTLEENRETSDNVTFTRTIDPESSFFSSLDLKKISSSDNQTVTEKPQQIIGSGTSDNIQEKSPISQNTNEHINSSGESTAPILNGDPKMNEPKIIRNFFKCVEFEEKLKYKTGLLDNQDWYDDDDDETDEGGLIINEDFTENYESNNFMSDYYTNYDVDALWYDGQNPEETALNGSLENSKALNTYHGDKAVTFKLLMEALESDILKAYTSIRDFCSRSSESLESEDLSADDTSRILARAEKTKTYICKVCDRLESILRQENTYQSIFRVEDGDMEEYRNYIGNCLEQGSILKESLHLVLRVCKLKAA